MHSRTASGESC